MAVSIEVLADRRVVVVAHRIVVVAHRIIVVGRGLRVVLVLYQCIGAIEAAEITKSQLATAEHESRESRG